MRDVTPYIDDTFDLVKEIMFEEMNSTSRCSLGTIVKINNSPVSVDIQPVINHFDKIEGFLEPEILKNIPVLQQGNAAASLRFPMNSGDVGVILWLDREGYSWLASALVGPKTPESGTFHNESACIFIPLLTKFSQAAPVKNLGVDIVSSQVSLLEQMLNLMTDLTTFCDAIVAANAAATSPLTPVYSGALSTAASVLKVSVTQLNVAFTTFKGEQ